MKLIGIFITIIILIIIIITPRQTVPNSYKTNPFDVELEITKIKADKNILPAIKKYAEHSGITPEQQMYIHAINLCKRDSVYKYFFEKCISETPVNKKTRYQLYKYINEEITHRYDSLIYSYFTKR